MWGTLLATFLLAEAVFCQEGVEPIRRLRFRRPRPKLIEVDNPEGELEGSPVPLLIPEESAQVFSRPSNRGSAALDALIATAQKEEPGQLEIEEVPTQAPLQLEPTPRPTQSPRAQSNRVAAGTPRRRVPGPPRRANRPRPEQADGETETPRGRPRNRERDGERERDEPIGTLERYSHKNEDGSFTFGYVGADGSFREETRGVDCITRGKYGYIDPDGVKREYTYTSGLPCEIGDDSEDSLQNLDGSQDVQDTIDPKERFRQTQNVQLAEADIPESAKRQRVRPAVRRPAEAVEAEAQDLSARPAFSNFGNNAPRAQIPQRRPVNNGAALNNLLNIAEDVPTSAADAPVTRRPAPRRPAPRPAAPANPGSFDFDAELEGFTLNRPSLTFEQNRAAQSSAPKSQFQSQLTFDQNTGTFQTQLQQNIQGSGQLNLVNNAAPFSVTPATPAIEEQDFTLTTRARPTTVITPRPTSFRASPTPSVQAGGSILPAGTFKLDFEPLNFSQGPTPTPAARRPAPTPAARRPAPSPTTPSLPAPTPAVLRTTAASPAPVTQQSGAPPPNTFFVFQPFNQQGAAAPSPIPASQPFQTPVNNNAFRIQAGQQPGAPRPAQQSFFPAGAIPIPQQNAARPALPPAFAGSPAPPQPARPTPPQQFAARPPPTQQFVARPPPQQQFVARPPPQQQFAARPAPVPQPAPARPAPVPQQAPPSTPQLQFGFQAIQPQQQQQNRPAPFTAFRSGTPPQIQGLQARPQQLGAPPQLGVPPQFQGAPQQTRFLPQNGPFPGRQPQQIQFRPQQQQQQQAPAFSVFNGGQQLRGA